MSRGVYLGMQRNVRCYAVTVVDEDETAVSAGALDDLVQMPDKTH